MNNLLSLQNEFQKYLLQGHSDVQKQVISTDKVSAETRLSIYGNAYRFRLLEALASNYPILKVYLGEKIFAEIAYDYINQYPSCYRSIRWFGDQLAYFISDHHQYKKFPYLSELAQFEWNMTLVFDAADSPLLPMEKIAQIPPGSWSTMRLYAHSSLHRINLSWNVVQLWQAISDEKAPDDPVQSPSPIFWMLWRRDLMNHFCSLKEHEAWAIDAMLKKLTFSEICEGLCQWFDEQEVGLQAASLLKGWIQSGLLIKVRC